ncbi:MAG TPA: class I SAM-dependent methyltransferase [Candidatus Limnocylindrales bacterium]|nr:class I SAM-dependent methyltransferase [Candidatus Limnocylindrales bacterium]
MPAANQKPPRKGHKGPGMEGRIARWYTRTRSKDMEDFRRQARTVAARLRPSADVLEVAPGPGFFSVELAKLGNFKITGLDISRTFIDIAQQNARAAGVSVDFRCGNAAEMPFPGDSFDFIYCSAAFKNFSEPVKALDEIYRVLRPGGEALIVDLRKDVSLDEIKSYMKHSGRSALDRWLTVFTFRHMLIKRAYTTGQLAQMAAQSRFGSSRIDLAPISVELHLAKPPLVMPAHGTV